MLTLLHYIYILYNSSLCSNVCIKETAFIEIKKESWFSGFLCEVYLD